MTKSNSECIFCRIASGEIPKTFLFESQEFLAFADIHPAAPVHILIIPREHVLRSMAELEPDQEPMIGRMMTVAKQIAEEAGVATDGYRLVFNVRHHGGQEVDHLHLHLLGGQPLGPLG